MRDTPQATMLRLLFNRQWWWTTLLVIAAVGVMVRLGLWQLDRLAERRAFNARVTGQQAQPPLVLSGEALQADLSAMEYRAVTVVGEYDHSQQVALRNQAWDAGQATVRAGVHLLTPLIIAGSDQAVLVDRGWIPQEEAAPEQWSQFDEPGTVQIHGVFRRSQSKPDFGGVRDPAGRLQVWNMVHIERIDEQVSYPLLPMYIQQSPDPAWTGLPYRTRPNLDLSEGSHLGYALQWFSFTLLLGIGYPFYVRNTTRRAQTRQTSRIGHRLMAVNKD